MSSIMFPGPSNGARRIVGLRPGSRVAVVVQAIVTAATVHDLSTLLWLCPLVQKKVVKSSSNVVLAGASSSGDTQNEKTSASETTDASSAVSESSAATNTSLTSSASLNSGRNGGALGERSGSVYRILRSPHLLHVQVPTKWREKMHT
jgi:hypothetical protein